MPPADVSGDALVLTGGRFATSDAKTAHGLVRGSERFRIAGVVDAESAGKDAGEVLDGKTRGIPVFATLPDAFARLEEKPRWGIVGIATAGRTDPGMAARLASRGDRAGALDRQWAPRIRFR